MVSRTEILSDKGSGSSKIVATFQWSLSGLTARKHVNISPPLKNRTELGRNTFQRVTLV